ncbi:basic proline-rich protein-like [Nannospalax galili]|uniref:basic proline-rich protein-like n=1 Tax=Nannospalax galili TaxID=1026970 RepID=UPI00111BECD8|nr:basic proline-rich protein-like [Nannospalax galili]
MCALVFDEVGALGEGLAADLTFIRLLTSMDALVLDQGGASPKALPADATDVRPRALPAPGPATPTAWTPKGSCQIQGILEHLKLGCCQQGPSPFPGTLLGDAVPPSPLRDPSGLPTSSGLRPSRGSRPHGDASRSIPASSQCSGGGDGGRSGDAATRLKCPQTRALPLACSVPPRRPGGLARAPKAGRLDPGLRRPLPSARPRPPPKVSDGPVALAAPRVVALGMKGSSPRPAAPSHRPQPETPPCSPPAPGWAAALRPPPPAQEVSVRGQVPPLASAAASLGAAGGGNSLALTLDWIAQASGWGSPDPPERAGGAGAAYACSLGLGPPSHLPAELSEPVPGSVCGQGRGDKRDQGQREGATLPGASGGGV